MDKLSNPRPFELPAYNHLRKFRYPGDRPSSGQPSSTQFPLFTSLPNEIQLLVWKHAAAAPGILLLGKRRILHSQSGLLTACTASRAAYLNLKPTAPVPTRRFSLEASPKALKWRLGHDLVVLEESVWHWLGRWDDLPRIPGAQEIRHLAIPVHYLFGLERIFRWGQMLADKEPLERRLTGYFPRLRTWEVHARWIDSLDQQAADGRRLTDPGVLWIPSYCGLRLRTCAQLLGTLDPFNSDCCGNGGACTEKRPCSQHVGVVKKRLIGRPIFHVDRAGLGLDP
ncbi:hypothetical protein PG996_013999 [Apiospora saccharicola]|uniref:Uncharacterized protein n=1 Tax=Apiospora saccharicola TaxID=335842 RepID=A0ABR1TJ26_9PEZI